VALTDGDFEQLYGHLPTRRAIEKAVALARQPIPLPPILAGLQPQARSISPLKMLVAAFRPSPSPDPPETVPVSAGAIAEPTPNAPPPPVFTPKPAPPSPNLPRLVPAEIRVAIAFNQYVVAEGDIVSLARDKAELRARVLAWVDSL
jgi:hypothetical protein